MIFTPGLDVWPFRPDPVPMSAEVAEAKTAGITPDVAAEIRSYMGRRDVSRAELARRLGVENSWIGKRLNGQTEIGVPDLYRIARALGVNMVDLLPREEREVTVRYPYEPVTVREPLPLPRPAATRSPLGTTRPPAGRPPNGPLQGRPSSARTRPTGL